jgi:lysine 2,3-aminomutase
MDRKSLKDRQNAFPLLPHQTADRELFEKLEWRDYAIIRILDYIDHAGKEYPDLNLHGEIAVSNPLRLIWLAVTRGTGGAKPGFFIDMIMLFRQLRGESKSPEFSPEQVQEWMDRFPDGLDPRIVKLREENKQRIIKILKDQISRKRSPADGIFSSRI